MIDRESQRGNRKRRQWGLHGRDRMGWKVNQMFRDISGHYYYRDWHYFKNAQRKWNSLQQNRVSALSGDTWIVGVRHGAAYDVVAVGGSFGDASRKAEEVLA